MSLAGLAATNFFSAAFAPAGRNKIQSPEQELQPLGKDLQVGDLPAAQSDFQILRQELAPGSAATRSPHHHAFRPQDIDTGRQEIAQWLGQLGQALQAGDVASARAAYASLLQDVLPLGAQNPSGGPGIATGVSVSA